MKKVLFALIVIVLAGGAWYMNSQKREDYSASMEKMQQLQSRIISNNLTDSDLNETKTAYDDAKTRRTKFETWRSDDKEKIKKLFEAYGLQTSPLEQLNKTIESPRDTYLNGSMFIAAIGTLLPPWDSIQPSHVIAYSFSSSTKTTKQSDYVELQRLSKSVNDLSHDIGLMTTFISSYDGVKNLLCTTDDATNNISTLGTVTMYTSNTKYKDVCDGQSVKQVTCSRNRVTLGGDGKPTTTTTLCPDGCSEGACLGASLGALSLTTSGGTAFTGTIKTGQEFYIKAASVSVSTGQNLTANITLPSQCTQTGSSSISVASASTNVQYGPIICSTTGAKTFKVEIKSGTTVLGTQTISTTIAQNTAERIEITNLPATITANTPFSATVTVYGGNDGIYTTYNKKFYISLIGSGDSTFPEAPQSFTGGTAIVNGLIFSTATTGTNKYTIKVVSEDRAIEKEVEVSVAAAQ